jgi:hypothetical protein
MPRTCPPGAPVCMLHLHESVLECRSRGEVPLPCVGPLHMSFVAPDEVTDRAEARR